MKSYFGLYCVTLSIPSHLDYSFQYVLMKHLLWVMLVTCYFCCVIVYYFYRPHEKLILVPYVGGTLQQKLHTSFNLYTWLLVTNMNLGWT